jgi:hypothetical protein
MMRFAAFNAAVALGALPLAFAVPAAATPDAPELTAFQQVPVDPFLDAATNGGDVYFQTPDGLLCGIRPAQGLAGCDGPLPGAPAGANELVLAPDLSIRGLRATANPQFVKPTGAAAPVLRVGQKIAFADFECAIGENPAVMCTKGTQPDQWMVIADEGTGIGPATPGLPENFPDPNSFVVGDDSYIVGAGAKNIFPVFTAGGGLTCKMATFSGGEIGCDTASPKTLPGLRSGDNEVYAQLPGPVGTRRAGNPPFTTPSYPGPIRQLPAGHRITTNGATCMATDDGVACFGSVDGPPQGFVVKQDETRTFAGQPR